MGKRLVCLSRCQKSSLVKLSILAQVWCDFSKFIFLPRLWARLDLVHVYLQSNHRLNSEKSSLLAVPIKLALSSVGNTVFFSEVMHNSMFHIFRRACITVFLMSVLICMCNFVYWSHRCNFFLLIFLWFCNKFGRQCCALCSFKLLSVSYGYFLDNFTSLMELQHKNFSSLDLIKFVKIPKNNLKKEFERHSIVWNIMYFIIFSV